MYIGHKNILIHNSDKITVHIIMVYNSYMVYIYMYHILLCIYKSVLLEREK